MGKETFGKYTTDAAKNFLIMLQNLLQEFSNRNWKTAKAVGNFIKNKIAESLT